GFGDHQPRDQPGRCGVSLPGGVGLPWAPGSATGIGSLPGTDIVEALRIVFGELPLPYLAELPARGPGADLVGRTAGLLVDLPVDVYAGRWRPISAVGVPVVVHCCAADAPVALAREAGAAGVALDLSLGPALDPLAEALDAGLGLFAGAFPAVGTPPAAARVAATVAELWHKLGLPRER